MSSTSTNTGTSSSTATYGRMPGASSPDIDTLRNTQFKIDPTIGFRAGSAKRRLENSFLNPLGGYSTPQRDEAIRRSMGRDIDMQAGMESRAGQYDVNNQMFQKNAYLAGLTAPPLVQTGTSGRYEDKFKTPFSAKILPTLMQAAQTAGQFAGGGAG